MALKSHRYYYLGLFALVFAAYANVYGNGFLLDDEFLLQKNRFITDWDYFWRIFTSSSTMGAGGTDNFYRPLQTLSYFVVYQFFGLSAPAFHALNVLLHAINASLIFTFATRRVRLAPLGAFLAASLWALHPLHTEAVTYMSATADSLYTLFVLCGLLAFQRIWLTNIFLVLGLLSKESAIVLAPMALVMDAVFAKKPFAWRQYLRHWPLWVTVVVYLLARKTILNFDNTFSFYAEPNLYTESIWYRFLTFLGTLPMYAKLLVWPTGLHMERDFPIFAGWTVDPVMGLLLIGAAASAVYFERNRAQRPFSFAVLWFATAHLPHTGVLLPVNSLFLEHWMYLPAIGLFISIFWLLMLWKISWKWILPPASLIGAALGVATFEQNKVWKDPITFYENILSHAKGTTRVFNNLGMAYSEKGDSEHAMAQYLRAIEIKDAYPQVRHNLAEELMRRGDYRGAIPHLQRAIEINPRFYYSLKDLAVCYQELGDHAKAREYYNQYQRMRPD